MLNTEFVNLRHLEFKTYTHVTNWFW